MPTLQPTKRKSKKIVALPGEYMTRVKIPTRLVNAEYNYTLIQERIFNYVMHYLQYYIQQVVDGKDVMQLDLFKNNADRIDISIPLMTIAKPAYYDRARDAAKELASIVVAIPMQKQGKNYERFRGLFEWVDLPKEDRRQRSGSLQISMSKQVAEMLIDIEVQQGIPREYTAFLFEVTMLCRNKYTPRFYKMLSSWKKKGQCYMSIEEMKRWLHLGDKYTTSNGIKQHILAPVQRELKQFADLWFKMDHPDFEVKEGTKIVGWRFKIETPDSSLHYVKLKNSIIEILKRHFRLDDDHIKKLAPIFSDTEDSYSTLQYKILDLDERIRKDKSIKHVQPYVVQSLLNWHKPR